MSAKYPRSYHLPWSPGGTSDDKRMLDVSTLINVPLVVTEKCDGSNLTYTREHVFSRSHAKAPAHPSFDLAKATHARVAPLLSADTSVFCEYCYAVHSLEYEALPDYSLVFGVRDDARKVWWEWALVEAQAEALGLPTVPVVFRGSVGSERELRQLTDDLAREPSVFGGDREGIVVRLALEFPDDAFARSLAKWVRRGHVTTDEHWQHQEIRPQKLGAPPGPPRHSREGRA